MSKIFSDHAWEDDLPSIGTSFSFANKIGNKKERNVESKDAPKKGNDVKKQGWSVLLPKKDAHCDDKPQTSRKLERTTRTANGENDNPKSKKRKSPQDRCDRNDTTRIVHSDGTPARKKQRADVRDCDNGGQKCENDDADYLTKNQTSKKEHLAVQSGSFRDKLVERLKGSRFRFINEQLYKTTGAEAKKLFQEDPDSFKAYHEGYRYQIAQWTMNPLDRIIKSIRKLPENTIVADFGCGEARLGESIPNQTYSLDLIAQNSKVIACDMAVTPLESNFVNVVVFCLSLMGTNLADFLLEANRVLKVGGLLKIAEVSSRFDNVNEFVANVKKCGFELLNKDLKHKLFYFFNFKKQRTVLKGSIKIKQFSLKPCLYKKR